MSRHEKNTMDLARDEMFGHIHRCGVLRATPEQQVEWMDDTMDYMAERFPDLTEEQLSELRDIGTRFCQPAIPHGKGNTALSREDDGAETELAGAV